MKYFRNRKLRKLDTNAATLYHYLSDPSEREIARALGMPKTTVHDAKTRLRKAGLHKGRWSL